MYKSTICVVDGKYVTYDKEGNVLHPGNYVRFDGGRIDKLTTSYSGRISTEINFNGHKTANPLEQDDLQHVTLIKSYIASPGEIDDQYHYFDKYGNEIHEGDYIKFSEEYSDDVAKEVHLTENNLLGTDATNPVWIKSGHAVPCEYGIYPFEWNDMEYIVRIDHHD